MPYSFHAVKTAAEEDTLSRYGLQKHALTWGRIGRSAAGSAIAGGVGALLGGGKGYYESGTPMEDGSRLSTKERLQAAGAQALSTGLQGAAFGGLVGATTDKGGLKRLFTWKLPKDNRPPLSSLRPGRRRLREMDDTWGRKIKDNAISAGRFVTEFGREGIFGSPVNMASELKRYKNRHGSWAKGLGDYMKNYYWSSPGTVLDAAGKAVPRKNPNASPGLDRALQLAALAQPAYDLYDAAKTDDPNVRRGDLASVVGGLVSAPFTSRLGIVGAVAQPAIQQLARRLVQKSTPAYTPGYDPVEHGKLLLRSAGLNASSPDLEALT